MVGELEYEREQKQLQEKLAGNLGVRVDLE